ncbi:hypothetical protein ACLQ3C_16205 [Gordonia sp. DT30]|uniref:hypothetical protein n=1 Tax=unclassified Gordonia (in: high G+C Gram-positive bacteria) TaxID=2657482 RepID=UPI003CF550A7
MGQPTGHRPDAGGGPPGDDYRTPLLPGDYPPLGYSEGGLPRYAPADLTATTRRAGPGSAVTGPLPGQPGFGQPGPGQPGPGQVGAGPGSGGPGDGPPAGRRRRRRGVEPGPGATIGAFTIVGLVIVGLIIFGVRSFREETPTVTLPTAQPTDTYSIPVLPTQPSLPGTGPQQPPGGSTAPPGAQVTYTVDIDGTGTILYVDDVGVRTDFAPRPNWTVTFTAGRNPLRLLVVAGDGSAAKCTITVAGRPVADDSVDATSTRRTATCIA